MLEKMIDVGVNVFRLNFSHGDHREHRQMIEAIKRIRQDRDLPVAVMQDLSGSKIRTGDFNTQEVALIAGNNFTLSTDINIEGNSEMVYVDHHDLPSEVEEGDKIVLDDGRVELEVLGTSEVEIYCRVLRGSVIRGNRGLTVPERSLSLPLLSEKDIQDVKMGLEAGVDFVALSFVKSAEEIEALREIINENMEGTRPDIIAKIETKKGLENFDSILQSSDGIMVARGDLAVEISPENVPMAQKEIIKACNILGKPVITATQMLESMIESLVPTRAEVSDVANAILDGTDAVMLSAETSMGKNPLVSLKVMSTIALQTEKSLKKGHFDVKRLSKQKTPSMCTVNSVTSAAVRVSSDLEAGLIVALTDSGFTGRMLSRHKPKPLIIAMATDKNVYYKLVLSFGCVPVHIEAPEDVGEAFELVREYVINKGLAKEGDSVVVAAGVPFDHPDAKTNMLFVENI